MTYRQWQEWCEFYGIEPFGDERADLRAGIVASTISNRMRGKHESAAKPFEFMPYHRKQEMSHEAIISTLDRMIESG